MLLVQRKALRCVHRDTCSVLIAGELKCLSFLRVLSKAERADLGFLVLPSLLVACVLVFGRLDTLGGLWWCGCA